MDLSKQEMELFLLPIRLHSKKFFYHVLIRRASLIIMFYSSLFLLNFINLYSPLYSCTISFNSSRSGGGVLLNFAMQDQESSGLLDGQWMFTDNYLTKLSSLVQQPPTDL